MQNMILGEPSSLATDHKEDFVKPIEQNYIKMSEVR